MSKKVRKLMSFTLMLVMIISTFSIGEITASAGTVIENAISWALAIANDNSHGYSQLSNRRWGNPDYDCSSFVITAFKNAGCNVGSATYTGNMRSVFVDAGFTWIPKSQINLSNSSQLQRGDILLNEKNHTEIYIGNNQRVGAHSGTYDIYDRNAPGDNNGKEICVYNYSNSSNWDGILRYKEETNPPIKNTPEFDALFYYNQYSDLQKNIGYNESALYEHWKNSGIKEGRCASPYFDVKYYLNENDLKAAFGNDYLAAYNHYKTYITKEYRKLSPVLDLSYYKNSHNDLSSFNGQDLLNHFINFGINEGRRGSANFDPNFYKTYYSDMSNRENWYLYWHYCCNGIDEGRIGADKSNPVISNVNISKITSTSYTVSCKVSDDTGITSVKFPSWHSSKGGESAIWYEGTISNGVVTCTIPVIDLGNLSGTYYTHIYAYDAMGNFSSVSAGDVQIDAKPINERVPVDIGTNFTAFISEYGDTKYLTADDNANVTSRSKTNADSQRWIFKKNEDGSYTITSKSNGNCLDVAGALGSSSANVQIHEPNSTNAQKWFIYRSDNGRYWLRPACSETCVLDLAYYSLAEGAKLQTCTFNATKAQSFFIQEDVSISEKQQADLGYSFVATISNVGTNKVLSAISDCNVVCKTNEGDLSQEWKFVQNKDGSYTIISLNEDKCLDVDNAGSKSNTNVQVWELNGTNAQKWDIYEAGGGAYYLKPQCSDTCVLDLFDYNIDENANIGIHNFNSTTAQRYYINKIYEIGDVDCDGEITITDATLIQKHIANMISLTEEQQKVADVTNDGKINIDDVTPIQKYIAGNITELG